MPRRRRPGEPVALREIWDGRVFAARFANVVRDDPGIAAFHVPAGPRMLPFGPDGAERSLPIEPWELREVERRDRRFLSFAWPEVGYAVLLSWAVPGDRFRGWYVNVQSPLVASSAGFDYVDHALDVVVEPDGRWRLKDEAELREAVELGLFSPAEAVAFRTEAERAIARIEAGDEPFGDRWLAWRPDPAWPAPGRTHGWDAVR